MEILNHSPFIDKQIIELVKQQATASPIFLDKLIHHIGTTPFSADLLTVDAALWGSFWQFDVIAPGSRLPAVEVALLRGIRLDGGWSGGTTVDQFLSDLRQAISHPQAGIWTMSLNEMVYVIFARQSEANENFADKVYATIVWYCATTGQLQSGYRTPIEMLYFAKKATRQKDPGFQQSFSLDLPPAGWIEETIQQKLNSSPIGLAEQIDLEILKRRIDYSE